MQLAQAVEAAGVSIPIEIVTVTTAGQVVRTTPLPAAGPSL